MTGPASGTMPYRGAKSKSGHHPPRLAFDLVPAAAGSRCQPGMGLGAKPEGIALQLPAEARVSSGKRLDKAGCARDVSPDRQLPGRELRLQLTGGVAGGVLEPASSAPARRGGQEPAAAGRPADGTSGSPGPRATGNAVELHRGADQGQVSYRARLWPAYPSTAAMSGTSGSRTERKSPVTADTASPGILPSRGRSGSAGPVPRPGACFA